MKVSLPQMVWDGGEGEKGEEGTKMSVQLDHPNAIRKLYNIQHYTTLYKAVSVYTIWICLLVCLVWLFT